MVAARVDGNIAGKVSVAGSAMWWALDALSMSATRRVSGEGAAHQPQP